MRPEIGSENWKRQQQALGRGHEETDRGGRGSADAVSGRPGATHSGLSLVGRAAKVRP